jgi:hypothetical protein
MVSVTLKTLVLIPRPFTAVDFEIQLAVKVFQALKSDKETARIALQSQ